VTHKSVDPLAEPASAVAAPLPESPASPALHEAPAAEVGNQVQQHRQRMLYGLAAQPLIAGVAYSPLLAAALWVAGHREATLTWLVVRGMPSRRTRRDNPPMHVYRGFHHAGLQAGCALTIGNFDGVHRGHQAMLALLLSEARHRGLPAAVLTFEPHPRDFFATLAGTPEKAPARIANLRDKLTELERCGVDATVVLRFDRRLASLSPQAFIDDVLVRGLNAKYVLVGDDFRFGARRAGDYAMLDAAGNAAGFDVARMNSYEVHGTRVSSSAVREALAAGDMERAAVLLGRPYSISGHVIHGRKLGRNLGYPTLNLRFHYQRAAALGIFVVQVHGLTDEPLQGVASLGHRPTVEDAGRVLLETYCLDWPASLGREGGYGKLARVELLHKLRDEARYDGLSALTAAIQKDVADAREWFAAHAAERRQTTRDRIQRSPS
jgi:riboflavin kinase/FMN adenylyltransferase